MQPNYEALVGLTSLMRGAVLEAAMGLMAIGASIDTETIRQDGQAAFYFMGKSVAVVLEGNNIIMMINFDKPMIGPEMLGKFQFVLCIC